MKKLEQMSIDEAAAALEKLILETNAPPPLMRGVAEKDTVTQDEIFAMVDRYASEFIDNRWEHFRRLLADLACNYMIENHGFVHSVETIEKKQAVFRKGNKAYDRPPSSDDWIDGSDINIVKKPS